MSPRGARPRSFIASVTVDPFTAYLSTPVDQREWLTSREAMRLTGLSLYGLRSWRRAGLLPNTQWINPTRGFYLRSDLERVLAAPAYNNRGHSHAAVRAAIEAEADVAPTQVG